MGLSNLILTFPFFFILKGSPGWPSFLFLFITEVSGATITMVNKCTYTVWPGILGHPILDTTGFELVTGNSLSIQAPQGWSGRIWGRTGCSFDQFGHGSCSTADCGSGHIECNETRATPPATLAEFTLGSTSNAQDFYNVNLVDGYNVQMIVKASGGYGLCETTGCVEDLNRRCPTELKVDGGEGCRSACDTFGTTEHCCKREFGSTQSCQPSVYSQLFKSVCPRSYSYEYNDATSMFTCTAADYVMTFCPNSIRSGEPRKGVKN